jgi:protein-tyrosine kinase
MSLIEKAAERFERERIAQARGRVPTPPRDLSGDTDGLPENNQAPPPSTDLIARAAERMAAASRPIASAARAAPAEATDQPQPIPAAIPPVIPRAGTIQQAVTRTEAAQASRSAANTSQTFRLNFPELEKAGFVSRPFARKRLADDLRLLKHRLMNRMNFFSLDAHRTPGRRQNVVMVSSSWASEGKTFTAANLALSLALEDRVSVLLVDADVIRPAVHSIFGLPVTDGLTDYLRVRENDLSPYLWRAENAPLSVLPAGGPVQAPRELFRSDEMSRFIYDVSNRYSDRLVIVDTPPLLVTAEAPVLSNHADQILVVVQAGRTPQSALEDALDLLSAHDNVSLVLNQCNEGERLTTPEYYNYGFYQDSSVVEGLRIQS